MMQKLVYPLKIDVGTSRFREGSHFYLNDQHGFNLASTQNIDKVERWKELVKLTEDIAAGTDIKVEAVRYVVGVEVVSKGEINEGP